LATVPAEASVKTAAAVVLPAFGPASAASAMAYSAVERHGAERGSAGTPDTTAAVPPVAAVAERATVQAAANAMLDFSRANAAFVDGFNDPEAEMEASGMTFGFSHMSTGPAMPGSHPSGTASALPVPQIAAQLVAALSQSADGATELALSPDELGHIRLRLEPDASNPDRLVVMISFERPETLDLFRRHAGELAEALRQAGYAGADIGFGQQDGGSPPEKRQGFAGAGSGNEADQQDGDTFTPRRRAGTSLDLRL
jgi:Flagellar hook-length control protein FliK